MSNALQAFTKASELGAFLKEHESNLRVALPKHLDADRLIRLAQTQWAMNKAIQKCTPRSILQSVMAAAQLGLEPGVTGQGYIVPYRETAQFVPGWQGLVGLLNNTGKATAWTGAVFEGDEWEFCLGSSPKCRHVPGPNFGDASKMTWVYACGQVNGSQMPVIEAWPMSRVWKHRDKHNKVGSAHYSFQHPEMYARKVVLLQVLKYMPKSVQLSAAMDAANINDDGRAYKMDGLVVIDMEDEPKEATVPLPARRSRAKEEPAAEFPLDDPRKSPKEVLKDKMEASGLSWADVKSSLEDNGMSPGRTLDETDDETVNAAIKNFQHIQPL